MATPNQITGWDYSKPTKEGTFLICYGDVETVANMRLVSVWKFEDVLFVTEQGEGDNRRLSEYVDGWKWAELTFAAGQAPDITEKEHDHMPAPSQWEDGI